MNRLSIVTSISLSILFSIGFYSKAFAKDEGAYYKEIKPDSAIVGITDTRPWQYFTNGNFEGAGIDMLNKISKRTNIDFVFQLHPFDTSLRYMKSSKIDIIIGIFKRPEREEYIHFINTPYKSKSNKAFYVLKGNKGLIKKYEDLYQMNIGVESKVKYFPQFDKDKAIKKTPIANLQQMIKMLLLKRIDAFICTDAQADYYIGKLGLNHSIVKTPFGYYQDNPVYIGISKKSWLMNDINSIENTIVKMINEGEVDRIFADYFNRKKLPMPNYK